MIRHFTIITAVICIAGLDVVFAQVQGKFTPEQYKEALWMVTRFYGAQRQGEGPNWLLMDHTKPATLSENMREHVSNEAFAALTNDMIRRSFVNDAMDERDLSGGWFDCGDFVLFGQTFFYSAYVLARAYETFPTGFHDLYHGEDYRDFAESGDWSMAGGKPSGKPDLLEELKYATDWIIKATPNANTFYFQKGHGGAGSGGDHRLWTTSGMRSAVNINSGGEWGGSRDIYKNPNDGMMASFAAAALAVMSRIYRKYDPDYADLCLVHARNAYDYAKPRRSLSVGSSGGGGGHYPSIHENNRNSVFLTAAAEMFLSTGETTFRDDITGQRTHNHNWGFCYATPNDMAPYVLSRVLPAEKDTLLNFMRTAFVQRYAGSVNSAGLSTQGDNTWGSLRFNAGFAFIAALYNSATDSEQFDQFIYNQVDYILGANSRKQSFLMGFCEGCENEVKLPHHRNVFLRDDNPSDDAKAQMTIPVRNKYFGYMVGGTRDPNDFNESIQRYQISEGGIDYNAGLLGALAYIVSKLAPADTSKFGTDNTSIRNCLLGSASRSKGGYSMNVRPGRVTFTAAEGLSISKLSVYNLQGRRVFNRNDAKREVVWQNANRPSGMYLVRATMSNGAVVQRNVVLR